MPGDRDLLQGPIARQWVLCGERPSKALEHHPGSWMMPRSDGGWTVATGLWELSGYSKREWYELFWRTMLLHQAEVSDGFAARADGRRRLARLWERQPGLSGIVFVGHAAACSVAWIGGELPDAGEWSLLSGVEFVSAPPPAPATWLPLPLRSRHPAHVGNTLFHEFFDRLRRASAPDARAPWGDRLTSERWR